MHPFVHAFSPAIDPPWETRTDFDMFRTLARASPALAPGHLGVRKDLVAVPLLHDTPDEMAVPGGVVRDWKTGEVDLIPGVTVPKLVVVERDYPTLGAKMSAPRAAHGQRRHDHQGRHLLPGRGGRDAGRQERGDPRGSPPGGRRSDTTSTPARRSSRSPAPPTAASRCRGSGTSRSAPAAARRPRRATTRASASPSPTRRPGRCRSSPARSGRAASTAAGATRPFTINVEQLKPWHTLTGPAALLPRPRLDERARREPADLPAAAGHAPPRRRPAHRRRAWRSRCGT